MGISQVVFAVIRWSQENAAVRFIKKPRVQSQSIDALLGSHGQRNRAPAARHLKPDLVQTERRLAALRQSFQPLAWWRRPIIKGRKLFWLAQSNTPYSARYPF